MTSMTAIRIGDVLTRPKAAGFVTHAAVAIWNGLVLHNTPEKGEHAATVREFAAGGRVTVHHTGMDPSVAAARAHSVLANPQGYDPIKNNCEHTVTKVVHGKAWSPQVKAILAVVIVAMVAGLLWLLLRRR